MNTKLQHVVQHLKKLHHLKGTLALLQWDQQVGMPKNAHRTRSEQISLLQGLLHEHATNKTFGRLIEELKNQKFENEYDNVMIKLAYEDYQRNARVPKELIEEQAKVTSEAFQVWVQARQSDNFDLFAPKLKRIINLKKEIAKYIDDTRHPFDVTIDEYDRGMTFMRYTEIFDSVKDRFIELIKRIKEAKLKNPVNSTFLNTGNFKIESQKALNKFIAQKLGYSFDSGKLDTSTHPFTSSFDKFDVRITTRYRDGNFIDALAATIHETGHALYEQSLHEKYYFTPVGKAQGMSMHESQSILYERHVGLSKPFWKYMYPIAQKYFDHLPNKDINEIYRAVNDVEPGLIRVEADEVTYPMHVILRFELEKLLMEDAIQVEDIPRIWREKMKEYLGIEPTTNATGALQDIHWSLGAIGYFPSYLCGQMLASQIFNKIKKEIKDIDTKMENGEFLELKDWLNKNIHQMGSLYSIDELMIKVTGEKLNPKYLLEYLEKKYSEIYNF